MACYNRKPVTLQCLRSLYQSVPDGVDLKVFVFDDNSPDGTAAAVRAEFPSVHVVDGDGNQFWVGGMRAAMAAANQVVYDFLLWLNDDVRLHPEFLRILLGAHDRAVREVGEGPHVIVGAVVDPRSGQITYSGCRRTSRIHPAKLVQVSPDPDRLVACDTMNGNCVLFPAKMTALVGEIDSAYVQQIGDTDYGYRCVKAGGKIWLASEVVGTCLPNNRFLAWDNPALSFTQRWKLINKPHGLPLRPWFHFMYKFGGPVAIPLLFWSYAKGLVGSLIVTPPRT
jgi:GT2 family glycosyltransferase